MLILLLGHHCNLVLLVQAINKVKVKCYFHGQGLFKVNLQAGGGPATERHSCYQCRHTVPSYNNVGSHFQYPTYIVDILLHSCSYIYNVQEN